MTIRKSTNSLKAAFGTVTLVAGTLAGIDPGMLTSPGFATIILSRNTPAGTLGFLTAPSASRGVAASTFTITSTDAAETSTVNWLAIPRQNIPSFGIGAGGPFRRPPSGTFIARGRTTLVAGTKTVTAGVPFSANAKVFCMIATIGGPPGKLSAPSASINVSANTFVINSNSGADTSTVDWILIDEPIRSSASGPFLYQANQSLVGGFSTYTGADGVGTDQMSVIASVISTGGTPDTLTAPVASRTATGQFQVISNNGADTSLLEVAVF